MALIALTAALTKYYNPELFDKITRQALLRTESLEEAQTPGAKRQKTKRTHTTRLEVANSGTSTPTSPSESKANKRRKLVSAPVEKAVVAVTADGQQASLPRVDDDGMSNRDFAQQLAKAQAGTNLEASKAQSPSKKERRAAAKATPQLKQNGLEASGISTETSSTTGRDADDDLSPVGSPASGAVSTAPTSRAGDVSDMLEAPGPKTTTLRLTDIKDTISKSVPKSAAKAFQPVLSKKQRQRQAKQAEQKAFREESDRLHEGKKQAQMRTARMAEGTSNQTKADSFAPKHNVWQAEKPASAQLSPGSSHTEVAPLLDTLEETPVPATKVNGAVHSEPMSNVSTSMPTTANINAVRKEEGEQRTSALAASSREKAARPGLATQPSWADEVNDEEQDKWAQELTHEEKWESVTTKKGKKKGKKDNDTSSDTSSLVTRPPTTIHKSTTNGLLENGAGNRFQAIVPSTNPSFIDAEWEA